MTVTLDEKFWRPSMPVAGTPSEEHMFREGILEQLEELRGYEPYISQEVSEKRERELIQFVPGECPLEKVRCLQLLVAFDALNRIARGLKDDPSGISNPAEFASEAIENLLYGEGLADRVFGYYDLLEAGESTLNK